MHLKTLIVVYNAQKWFNIHVMSRVCEVCGKSSQKGKKITKVWGVKYRSIRHRQPNLRKTTLISNGETKQVKVCAKCLKSIKREKIPNVSVPSYSDKSADIAGKEN